MANSIDNETKREKYAKGRLDYNLRRRAIAAEIFMVDNSANLYVDNPFVTTTGANAEAMAGTLTLGDLTITNDRFEVTEWVHETVHIFDFENRFNDFDLFSAAIDEMTSNVALMADKIALNKVADNAGANIATLSGGMAQANIDDLFGKIAGEFAGYQGVENGVYLAVENTEVPGLVQKQILTGFSFADATANNGLGGEYMGVEIYVTRTGTFVNGTVGTGTYTNANVRLCGVKKTASFAMIREGGYREVDVSLKTGKEVSVFGYVDAHVWTTKAPLTATVTLTT